MNALNDAKKQYLENATGIIGNVSINDLELIFYENLTLQIGNIQDLKSIYYQNLGFEGNLNDQIKQHLESLGYVGENINDNLLAFYSAGPQPE